MPATSIGWVVEFKINPGKLEAFKARAEEMSAVVEKHEPQMIRYEWWLSPDATTCTINEWFADEAGGVAHLTGEVMKYFPKLMELGTIEAIHVYGTPTGKLAELLKGFPVTATHSRLTGFRRGA